MAKDFDSTQRALLRNSIIMPIFCLDLFVDGTSMHCVNTYAPLVGYDVGDGVERDYEAMADRFNHGDTPITMGADLSPEPLVFSMDASRVLDDDDFVGRFADLQTWHRRRCRYTMVATAVGSSFALPVANIITWEGNMDFREFPEQEDTPPRMLLTCESGTFRYLSRNLQTRTDENQQRIFPGDKIYQDIAGLIGREIPWHRSWISNTPTNGGGGGLTHSPRIFENYRF